MASRSIGFICLCLFVCLTNGWMGSEMWDRVVKKYVSVGELEGIPVNLVDFKSVKNDSDFNGYLTFLRTANLTGFTKNQTYAFYINVYNVLAVNMIIENACETDLFGKCGKLVSIHDIDRYLGLIYGGVWDKRAGIVGGKEWSLDNVEDFLRDPKPYKEDPRLHSCIVCASISCPNLRTEAYVPERIDAQMTDNFNIFINNTKKGMYVDRDSKTVTVSLIFDWFESDFVDYAGGVIDFILLYLNQSHPDYNWLQANKKTAKINHFHYNWNVNSIKEDIPCNAAERPCYQLWALFVTIAGIILLSIMGCCLYCCIRKKMRSGYGRLN